jgi:hypothetical protein
MRSELFSSQQAFLRVLGRNGNNRRFQFNVRFSSADHPNVTEIAPGISLQCRDLNFVIRANAPLPIKPCSPAVGELDLRDPAAFQTFSSARLQKICRSSSRDFARLASIGFEKLHSVTMGRRAREFQHAMACRRQTPESISQSASRVRSTAAITELEFSLLMCSNSMARSAAECSRSASRCTVKYS